MGLFSRGNRKSCLGRIISLIVIVAVIVGLLYILGILPADGSSEGSSSVLEEVSGLLSATPGSAPQFSSEVVTVSPSPYATKPVHTAPGGAEATPKITTKPVNTPPSADAAASAIDEDGSYTDKENVALYIHTFGRLPANFITKSQAEDFGWVNSEGNLDEVAPGKSIGGSRFGNYEGLLPEADGRVYYECDINYGGGYRGSERIVYSNDGLVFYTGDHYQSFEQLY